VILADSAASECSGIIRFLNTAACSMLRLICDSRYILGNHPTDSVTAGFCQRHNLTLMFGAEHGGL